MKRWLLLLVLVLLGLGLLILVGCGNAKSDATTDEDGTSNVDTNTHTTITELIGPTWKLKAMDGCAVASDIVATIQFGADSMYFAQAPVNTVRGPFSVEGEKLTLQEGAMTQMAGIDEAHNAAEKTFVDLLKRVVSYKLQGTSLALLDNAGTAILEFEL